MDSKKRQILIYPLLICSMILWGASFVWGKVALEHYGTFTVIFFRLLVSSVMLVPVLIITKKFRWPEKKNLYLFLLLAFFEPFLYFLGETSGLAFVDPSMASVIISIIPLFTPFVAYYFLKEKVTILNMLGIIISISGIVFLVLGKDMSLQISVKGLLLLCLAIFAANGYSVMLKKIPDQHSILNIILWQNIFGMIYFLPFVAIFSRHDIMVTGFVEEGFWAIVELGFFASTLAFLFYMYGLKFMSITKVNVFTNTIPIFTIIISWFFFGEEIGTKKIIGIIIVISGVVISQLKYRLFPGRKS